MSRARRITPAAALAIAAVFAAGWLLGAAPLDTLWEDAAANGDGVAGGWTMLVDHNGE